MASTLAFAKHMHDTPDRQLHQYLITQFSQAGCSFWCPINSIKALKAKKSRQHNNWKSQLHSTMQKYFQWYLSVNSPKLPYLLTMIILVLTLSITQRLVNRILADGSRDSGVSNSSELTDKYPSNSSCRKISITKKQQLTSTHSVTLDLAMCLIATYHENIWKMHQWFCHFSKDINKCSTVMPLCAHNTIQRLMSFKISKLLPVSEHIWLSYKSHTVSSTTTPKLLFC